MWSVATSQDAAIKAGWDLLNQAVQVKPGKQTILLFDELSDTLCKYGAIEIVYLYSYG